jgi:hypothetical protein
MQTVLAVGTRHPCRPARGAAALAWALGVLSVTGLARGDGEGPTVIARTELSAYGDTDQTAVVTPAIIATIDSPTSGWGVTGSYLVDVVTTASADIVATASPRWTEVRHAQAIAGHRRFGAANLSLHGGLSHEPDYLSVSGGGGVSVDLASKTWVPSLSYTYSHDTVGRSDTPFEVFSRVVQRHALDAATTVVIDKATVAIAAGTAVFEVGDGSKPYRAVPVFQTADAANVYRGMRADEIDRLRAVERPLEQLPTDRQRWAVEGRILHRYSRSTVRIGERLYLDSWGLKASTTDLRWPIDVHRRLTVWPHLRLHAQTGVDFWRLAYVATPGPGGAALPALRTGDRELGPLLAFTTGIGSRLQLGRSAWTLGLEGDAVFTEFLDHLYIEHRAGLLGTLSIEAKLE